MVGINIYWTSTAFRGILGQTPSPSDPIALHAGAGRRARHKYAWVPFGGGAHMCIGLHFAYMQMKAFFYTLLAEHRVVVAPGYKPDIQMFPIPKPRDGLPIRVERI